MSEAVKDRVIMIGDVTSGFRVHGPFADNAEAFEYVERYREIFDSLKGYWSGAAQSLVIVNFDTMNAEDVAAYEKEVGGDWNGLRDAGWFQSVDEGLLATLGKRKAA